MTAWWVRDCGAVFTVVAARAVVDVAGLGRRPPAQAGAWTGHPCFVGLRSVPERQLQILPLPLHDVQGQSQDDSVVIQDDSVAGEGLRRGAGGGSSWLEFRLKNKGPAGAGPWTWKSGGYLPEVATRVVMVS